MRSKLFITKSFDSIQREYQNSQLKRSLGPWQITALGIGCVIGTGIFVLTGLEAAVHAGPAVVISIILAGIACGFAGLCYAEFAAMAPVSGSAYSYSYATLGEFAAWFIGWDLLLEYMFAAGTVSVGWGRYFTSFLELFGIQLPASLTNAPFTTLDDGVSIVLTGDILNLPAVGIALFVTWICYIGITQSSFVNTVIVIVKVAVILAIIGFGAFYVNPSNWTPFIPENTGDWGNFGWSGIFRAASVLIFAYIGFDAVTTAAQEARKPSFDLPFGLLASLIICTVLFVLMSAVLSGLVPYPDLNTAAPVAVALNAHEGLRWLSPFVVFGALAGLTSVVLVLILGQSRILLAMSRDGLLPAVLGSVHPKNKTPHVATLITGGVAALMAGLFPIGLLAELVSIGTLIAFTLVSASVLVLRYTRPDVPRPFKVPAPWFVCSGGVICCGILALSLPLGTWLRLIIWMLIGIVVYYFYGRHHSVARKEAQALDLRAQA
ncbi:MAG: amino acid permease [Pseudomonadales bacterium]|jgi:APA family basic amino acid/polyamine antiporter|nr:amino acid permease [Pseudomonadales bacterium]